MTILDKRHRIYVSSWKVKQGYPQNTLYFYKSIIKQEAFDICSRRNHKFSYNLLGLRGCFISFMDMGDTPI